MPKFLDAVQPAPPRNAPRELPQREPRIEPAGLDAFAGRAGVTPPPEARGKQGRGRVLPASPMPVRFPPDVKDALERLSASDQRSQQQILERVAFPAILDAARRL